MKVLKLTKSDARIGLILDANKIIPKVWEEKYIPAEEVEGFVEDCKTTGEEYKQVMLTLTMIDDGTEYVGAYADADCYF